VSGAKKEETLCHPEKVTLLPIPSVKAHNSLAQEVDRKVQDSSLPDLLCLRPAVPFMQTPSDDESGGVFFAPLKAV
jgi:hypothetical protein